MIKNTILVEIAAYCDKQLLPTVESALKQADHPENLHFAICYQDDDKSDYEKLKKMDNMSIVYMTKAEAQGLCYARNVCQKMLRDEEFVLHIDSHMRFVKHWDTEMIKELRSYNDKKALISVYPPALTDEMLACPVDDPVFDKPAKGYVMQVDKFRENSNDVKFKSRAFRTEDANPKKNILIAGGYLFAFAQYDEEVKNDPNMFFYQDELSISLRGYTYGYTVYNPRLLYIYHYYHRVGREMPKAGPRATEERIRVEKLFSGDNNGLDEYGLGHVRTLRDFEKRSGLQYNKHKIYKFAQSGYFYEENIREAYNDEISFSMFEEYLDHRATKQKKVHVYVCSYSPQDAKKCIESAIDSLNNAGKVCFTIITTEKEKFTDKFFENIKIVSVEEKAYYSKHFQSIDFSSLPDDEICLFVDSGIYFAKTFRGNDWREYLIRKLNAAGKNAVLSFSTPKKKEDGGVKFNYTIKPARFKGYTLLYETNKILSDYEDTPSYLLCDGVICGYARTFKEVPFDGNLRYDEHLLSYAARLWTYGYDIYCPAITFFCREGSSLMREREDDIIHHSIMGFIFQTSWVLATNVSNHYSCGIGFVRRIKTWCNFVGIDYGSSKVLK